jgi:hypothetical protein
MLPQVSGVIEAYDEAADQRWQIVEDYIIAVLPHHPASEVHQVYE